MEYQNKRFSINDYKVVVSPTLVEDVCVNCKGPLRCKAGCRIPFQGPFARSYISLERRCVYLTGPFVTCLSTYNGLVSNAILDHTHASTDPQMRSMTLNVENVQRLGGKKGLIVSGQNIMRDLP